MRGGRGSAGLDGGYRMQSYGGRLKIAIKVITNVINGLLVVTVRPPSLGNITRLPVHHLYLEIDAKDDTRKRGV